jgi:Zn-dependent protease with chaperone function
MLRAFFSQSILHALVAALVANALLRAWRVEHAEWRLRVRLVALALPPLALPLFFAFAPWRNSAAFVSQWALFAGERWNRIRLGPEGLGDILLVLSAGLGSALFLRDALPPILDGFNRGWSHLPPSDLSLPPASVRTLVERLAATCGIQAPVTRLVRSSAPVLLCEGLEHPRLVISTRTLDLLDDDALEAAIAHELSHASRRDPRAGYLLIAIRALLFFNPAAQWMARVVVDDLERRADDAAVRLTGRGVPLARAVRLLFEAGHPPPLSSDAPFHLMAWQARKAAVDRRCHRLEHIAATDPARSGMSEVILAAAGMALLVFFIV